MLRVAWNGNPGGLDEVRLWDDNGFTYGGGPWTDLLEGQTTIRVEWSKNGTTWGGTDINLTDPSIHFNHAAIADGAEWLVRFVIGGVTYGPISVRFYA